MDLWKLGFVLLVFGIGIPLGYGIYSFFLSSMSWYWRASIILVVLGLLVLLSAALKDRMGSGAPEKKY